MLAVHTETPPQQKYQSVLEPGYLFDPDGAIKARIDGVIPEDDGTPWTFMFHFPAGTLAPRMSGLELATLVIEHVRAILGQRLLNSSPRAEQDLMRVYTLFTSTPAKALDEVLGWVQSVKRGVRRPSPPPNYKPPYEEQDVVLIDLSLKHTPERKMLVFY